jgi:hypothetical protein
MRALWLIPDPYELASLQVLPYLLPSESIVVEVRKHPAVLMAPSCLLIADVTAFSLSAADVTPEGAMYLVTFGLLFPLLSYLFYRSKLAWQRALFVVTSRRIILASWRRSSPLIVLPVTDAEDMVFSRTVRGRLLSYGSFKLWRLGTDPRAFKIDYLPYPEQIYLEVCGLVYRGE